MVHGEQELDEVQLRAVVRRRHEPGRLVERERGGLLRRNCARKHGVFADRAERREAKHRVALLAAEQGVGASATDQVIGAFVAVNQVSAAAAAEGIGASGAAEESDEPDDARGDAPVQPRRAAAGHGVALGQERAARRAPALGDGLRQLAHEQVAPELRLLPRLLAQLGLPRRRQRQGPRAPLSPAPLQRNLVNTCYII